METYSESTYVLFNLFFINKIYIYLLRFLLHGIPRMTWHYFEQFGIWDKKNL